MLFFYLVKCGFISAGFFHFTIFIIWWYIMDLLKDYRVKSPHFNLLKWEFQPPLEGRNARGKESLSGKWWPQPQSIIYHWVWKYHFFPLKEVEISHSLLNKFIKKLWIKKYRKKLLGKNPYCNTQKIHEYKENESFQIFLE